MKKLFPKRLKKLLIGFTITGVVVTTALALLFALSSNTSSALAALPALNKPFGGRVILNVPCIGGYAIHVGPPRGGTYIFTPFSRLFEYFLPLPANWVLGLAVSTPIPCLIPSPFFGIPIPNPLAPAGFPIIIMGTSATP